MLMLAPVGICAEQPLLVNGGFEAVRQAAPGPDGLVNLWRLGDPAEVPQNWQLNTSYPGQLVVGTDGPHSGERFGRLTANGKTSAHLYQLCEGLAAGEWYRVSLWVRGGPVIAHFYEYYKEAPIGGQRVLQGSSKGNEWRQLSGYYHPGGNGYLRSALAVYVDAGHSADVDDVVLEPLGVLSAAAEGADLTYENDVVQLTLAGNGMLKRLRRKGAEEDYAARTAPFPVFSAVRDGVTTPVRSVTQEGEAFALQFLDPDVKASLRILPRRHHFLIEVLSMQPADVDELTVDFPVKRLKEVAGAFNATYDDQFGACLFGTTANTRNLGADRGSDVRSLRGSCYRAHGIVGAKFALVAAPFDQFKAAIMEAERENGVPCPLLDGKWARESEPVRRSYLFGTGVTEADIDTLIEYAKIGGFGTIIMLKNDWLANHGHFDLNTTNFPAGLESLKRAVQKIHKAGLHAGVHVFGPSISPNDPYITPTPDDRLAFVPCPPLAEAADEKATTLTFAAEPNLPPKTVRTPAFPGHHLRIGDEIIGYDAAEPGPPFRYVKCQRGALGTKATPHAAGAEVKGLLTMWSYFLVDPDSTLADELTRNFADAINACDFDMVYFDASDGVQDAYLDRWYYLNKMHLDFYRKLKRDVLYQTSNGTGSDLLWHLVPRSASADGHGDIKGYLDDRWPGILGQARNFTRSDIGWYYWFKDVRPDQMEYVAAKALGVDGSLSVETSRAAMETLTQSRQMFEMLGRWERCRRANYFPETVRAKLREPRKDFKLFAAGRDGWKLQRAAYEEPRVVDVLDGERNRWTIDNDLGRPCDLGVEVVRGTRQVALADYTGPTALTIETFDEPMVYQGSDRNQYEKYVVGGGKMLTQNGPVREGVTQTSAGSTDGAKAGGQCLVYAAENKGAANGWGGIGRRFAEPLDLSRYKGVGLWIQGDCKYETVRLQFRDVAGRYADFVLPIDFGGWRLFTFPLPADSAFDWSKTEYLLFYFNSIPANTSVRVLLDDVKMLPDLQPSRTMGQPVLTVNGQRFVFPAELAPGQALTSEAAGGTTFWPGGMEPGKSLELPASLVLKPGKNEVTFSHTGAGGFPGDVSVLLYRMWPLED
jgi:hypothetical protein